MNSFIMFICPNYGKSYGDTHTIYYTNNMESDSVNNIDNYRKS